MFKLITPDSRFAYLRFISDGQIQKIENPHNLYAAGRAVKIKKIKPIAKPGSGHLYL